MSHHPLRIAMLSEHASPLASAGGVDAGGQNVYVDNIARQLGLLGHRVDILTRRDCPDLPDVVQMAPGVRVFHVEAGPQRHVPKEELLDWMPEFARQAQFHLLGEGRYDAMHANFFMSGWVGLVLRSVLQAPLVTTFHALGLVRRQHQGEADGFPQARESIERTLAHYSDRLIAECPQDRQDLIRLYDAAPERIDMIPCGVDTQMFQPGNRAEARARLGLPQDEFIVLQLGRLVPRKGIDNVIRAVSLLPADTRTRLVVVGGASRTPEPATDPELARLMQLAADAGVAERVSFVGRREREELCDWYVAADVFVTTPWYEPFGITPLEAMACATPVIGSEVGGICHSVRDGVTGHLVSPRNPQELAHRLMDLQRQPQLAHVMGRAGLARVKRHFTWEHVAREFVTVFENLAHQSRQEYIPPRPVGNTRTYSAGVV